MGGLFDEIQKLEQEVNNSDGLKPEPEGGNAAELKPEGGAEEESVADDEGRQSEAKTEDIEQQQKKTETKKEKGKPDPVKAYQRWKNDELLRKIKDIEGKLDSFAELKRKELEPKEIPPDKDLEPDKWYEFQAKKLQQRLDEIQEKMEKTTKTLEEKEKQEKTAMLFQAAIQEMNEHEQEFSRSVDDYKPTIEAASNILRKTIRIANPDLGANEVNSLILGRKLKIAAIAKASGEDPAKAIYEHAKFIIKEAGAEIPPQKAGKDGRILDKLKKQASPLHGGAGGSVLKNIESEDFGFKDYASLSPKEMAELEKRLFEG